MAKKREQRSGKKSREDWIPHSKVKAISRRLKKTEKDLTLKSETKTARPKLSDPRDLLEEMTRALKDNNTDTLIKEMVRYALGDVVGLGLMSQSEFDATEELDEDENVVRMGGRARALEMIPAIVRAKMLSEVAPYFLAKKGTASTGPVGIPPKKVIFKVPDNGRPLRETES